LTTHLTLAKFNRLLLGFKAKKNHIKQYISQPADFSASINQSQLLSVDLEMTGLDASKHEVISMAWVPIINGEIILAQARSLMIAPERGVGDSATIHGIHDCDLHDAISLEQGIEQLLSAMRGRVLVAHHGALDIAFLQQAAQRLYGHKLPFELIDTLLIESKRLSRQGQHFDQQLLRLYPSCARYGLPHGTAHNALADALATAQLLLAQMAAIGGKPLSLKDIMRYSH